MQGGDTYAALYYCLCVGYLYCDTAVPSLLLLLQK